MHRYRFSASCLQRLRGEDFAGTALDGVPETAKPLALIMEDPDAEEPNPFVHWMLYNLPSTVTSLPRTGPPHHYHFQIFAVTEMLSLLPSASREALLAALNGRAVATGDLTVTFQAPVNAR